MNDEQHPLSAASSADAASPSRRQFLQTTAVAGAAALLTGCGSLSMKSAAPLPTAAARVAIGEGDPVRIGVIGPGGMGTGHCHAFIDMTKAGHANAQIVALCDVCEPRLESTRKACADKQGFAVDTYNDYHELLARDDIHGVLVATPEHWHAPMVEDAVAAGKDVYVEKPMTLRLPEALRLRDVVAANPDARVQVGTQKMMLPKFVEARCLIAEGAIGKPTFSQTSYCRNSAKGEWLYYGIDPQWEPGVNLDWDRWCGPLGPQPWNPELYARWRRYRLTSTGIIGDLLVHQMTPLMMALDAGWPTRVVASGGHYIDKAMENHDQVNINAEFEKEHTMLVAGSTCNAVGFENLIRGHKGNMYLGSRHCDVRPERLFSDDIDPQKVECEDIGNDQDALRRDWLDSIRTRKPVRSPVELATQVMVIVDLATRSMWDGKAYEFDPKTLTARAV